MLTRKNIFLALSVALMLPVVLASCGYKTELVLPKNIQSIYVETVENKIPIDQLYAYQQGLEMDLTNAVIRRFQIDGNLKVMRENFSDAVLKIELKAFEQEGVRFNLLETVEEYRLFMVVGMKLIHRESQELIWEETNFSGDTEYFVTDVRDIGQQKAAEDVVEDLAKKIVDRVVEDW